MALPGAPRQVPTAQERFGDDPKKVGWLVDFA
jgi:hypothetical protein